MHKHEFSARSREKLLRREAALKTSYFVGKVGSWRVPAISPFNRRDQLAFASRSSIVQGVLHLVEIDERAVDHGIVLIGDAGNFRLGFNDPRLSEIDHDLGCPTATRAAARMISVQCGLIVACQLRRGEFTAFLDLLWNP